MAYKEAHCTQTVTKYSYIKPWPTNITDQLAGDFQQGGCLYKPTSGIQWTLQHSWMSDRPQKQDSAKEDPSTVGSGVLVIS